MARRRASMREGPLAELFRATEAAQRAKQDEQPPGQPELPHAEPDEPTRISPPDRREEAALEATVEHVYDFDETVVEEPPAPEPELPRAAEPTPLPVPEPEPELPPPAARAEPLPAPEPEPVREAPPYEPPTSRFLQPMPEQAPRLNVVPRDSASYLAVIRVVGVGGAGLNAVNRMMDAGIAQVDFVGVNTDSQQLNLCDAPTKLHIGQEVTQGLGSGADPDKGRQAAEDHAQDI
jgi:cell division protein FtsZ